MNSNAVPTIIAMIVQSALGVVVFYANPKRRSNQCFLLLTLVILAWLSSILTAFLSQSEFTARVGIRESFVFGYLYLLTINLFRRSIISERDSWQSIILTSKRWLAVGLLVSILCQTPFFLREANLSPGNAAPSAVYGPGIYLYTAVFAGAVVFLII